jgi:hypothetical protein
MAKINQTGFHNHLGEHLEHEHLGRSELESIANLAALKAKITYTFNHYFHPFVDDLLKKLNEESIDGFLNVEFQGKTEDFFKNYQPQGSESEGDEAEVDYAVEYFPKQIEVKPDRAFSVYNWELFFHIPLAIAVHLSHNQRFAEAQRWFHYIFDPTTKDNEPAGPERFWRFIGFRDKSIEQIDDLMRRLSDLDADLDEELKLLLDGYNKILENPSQPHAVARTRPLAYMYYTVMKYLDNLIDWGDSLFRQDTIESINEATLLYVLAANLLGPKPQELPPRGRVKPKTFAQLRSAMSNNEEPLGNAMVELEAIFPFNLTIPGNSGKRTDKANPLFGIGRTLYFCFPPNDKLLSYWDKVADRLFKIRHCMNIEGMVRELPLFEPPIDPGLLVQAAAAGLDINSLVSGLNQPPSPVRAVLILQKALEICGEVRSMGNNLLSVLEKKDGEALSLLRQKHEIKIQQLMQNVRYLQCAEAKEATESLLKSRSTVLAKYKYYQQLLGKKEEDLPEEFDEEFTLDKDLVGKSFQEAYQELVAQFEEHKEGIEEAIEANFAPYEQAISSAVEEPISQQEQGIARKGLTYQATPKLAKENSTPAQAEGTSQGNLYLSTNEDEDLNKSAPKARDNRNNATATDITTSTLSLIPTGKILSSFTGMGPAIDAAGGPFLDASGKNISNSFSSTASNEESKGVSANKTASYERRADDWILQSNLAAKELIQIGRQLIGSIIREQITLHELENQKRQVQQSQEISQFLQEKFSNEQLYGWMQGELSKLYYEYYKFAFDIARQAEQTLKQELMRPELDEMSFIKFNYWDGGRKGLLAGEALYLDLKRMEMAYHEHNKREYELTKHISLRQLNPIALLELKATGTCEVTLPEWFFDLDCPGHYMRRIKTVSLSIPSVTGSYTSVNCTLSLQKSTLRTSPELKEGGYERKTDTEDSRFIDYYGTVQSIVTSSAQNDSGLFEANLRDERFLPFEGAGVESTWRLELPSQFRQFDYNTIADVVLHLRYTAREGGALLRHGPDGQGGAVGHVRSQIANANASGLARLFSLNHEFPTEWHQFVASNTDESSTTGAPFIATIKKSYFPFFVQGKPINIDKVELHTIGDSGLVSENLELSVSFDENEEFEFSIAANKIDEQAQVFVVIHYSVSS